MHQRLFGWREFSWDQETAVHFPNQRNRVGNAIVLKRKVKYGNRLTTVTKVRNKQLRYRDSPEANSDS